MQKENKLGVMPIDKLIWNMSLPIIISMLVQALYNIVDSVFVSWVSEASLTAVSLAFPAQNLMISLASGTAVGVNALMGRALGAKDQKRADTVAMNGLFLAFVGFVLCAVLGLTLSDFYFRSQTDVEEIIQMGNRYLMIVMGASVGIFGQMMLERLLQGTGHSILSMYTQGTGAVINIILDPIFIFVFKMGVAGAAVATVIGQVAAGCLCLLYLRRLKTVRICRSALRPTRALTSKILALGFPSMLTQLLTMLVQVTLNNLMRTYGALSVYGSDIALSVYGMMMKVYQIAHSMFVGVSSAVQPINGYNFGAKHFQRVRQTYRMAAMIALGISVLWFLVFLALPRQIATLFVRDNPLYLDCAQHCFHLYMMAFFLYGLHLTTASFFQGIGKPVKALAIPLARQGFFLIPLAILLAGQLGLDGALLAAPIADVLTFLLCLLLARREFSSWQQQGWLSQG